MLKIKEMVSYGGHSLSANGSVNLTLVAKYSELVKTIQTTQMLNNDVKIKAKLRSKQPMVLGTFRIKQVIIDDDGESKIKFNGLYDFIEMDNLNLLPLNDADSKEFTVMFETEIEEEDAKEEEENEKDE